MQTKRKRMPLVRKQTARAAKAPGFMHASVLCLRTKIVSYIGSTKRKPDLRAPAAANPPLFARNVEVRITFSRESRACSI